LSEKPTFSKNAHHLDFQKKHEAEIRTSIFLNRTGFSDSASKNTIEPLILRTKATVILDDVLTTFFYFINCLSFFIFFNLKMKEALVEILISLQDIFINFASN
jgi:hypothetical protein